VRAIRRADLTRHPNPDFHVDVVEDPHQFYGAFAEDLVGRVREARDEGRDFVAILPVGPMPQYGLAARLINEERLSLAHVHTFNMDEYANEDGVTAPPSWPGSFQRAMLERFFALVDPALRPPESNIHFPTTDAIHDYSARIEDLGGADVCYGGIGWCGHIAFWESHLGHEFEGDLEAYKQAGARLVELHPMTIMQNALHSFGGDWSWVPPKANTIGPREILGARHRSFWLDGDIGGGVSWQRFIARLVAHGPVSEFVPGSILQTARTDYTILGGVAYDVEIHMA
jgi:glucosamine-6-phosphate deaminase